MKQQALSINSVVPMPMPQEKAQAISIMHNEILVKNLLHELEKTKDEIVQSKTMSKDYIAFQITQAAGMIAYLAKQQGLSITHD